MPESAPSVSKDISTLTESAKPQPASTGGAVAGTANTIDVASSASTPANHAASTSAAQSENKQSADGTTRGSDATGAASKQSASADFSSFSTANKQQSPFAVKAGGESTAFGSGSNALTFGTAAGGFGAIGQHLSMQ